VVGPAQAARQLQVWRDVVINLAEQRVGIQIVGVLAEEVVMALIVERGYGIWIDILRGFSWDALGVCEIRLVAPAIAQAIKVVRHTRRVGALGAAAVDIVQ